MAAINISAYAFYSRRPKSSPSRAKHQATGVMRGGNAAVNRTANRNAGAARKSASRTRRRGRKPDALVEQLMEEQGLSWAEAEWRIEKTKSRIDAAMDDGCMHEIEDIVSEELGDNIAYEDL